MTTEQINAREQLAKLEAEAAAARETWERIEAENKAQKEELLKQLRKDDLADVQAKCKLHGFTQTDLRGYLKTKGGGRRAATSKSATGKGTTRKTS